MISTFNNIKDISITIGILCAIGGAGMKYGGLNTLVSKNNEKIKEAQVRQKEDKKEIVDTIRGIQESVQENTKINVAQSVILENIARELNK